MASVALLHGAKKKRQRRRRKSRLGSPKAVHESNCRSSRLDAMQFAQDAAQQADDGLCSVAFDSLMSAADAAALADNECGHASGKSNKRFTRELKAAKAAFKRACVRKKK